MKEFFKKLNWFERIFPIFAIVALIVSFLVFKEKNWLSLISSLAGVVAFFCTAKGFFLAPFMSIVQSIFYLILSISQHYYGEMILGGFYILFSLATIFTWLKNRNKEDKSFVQVNKITKIEGILILPISALIGVGCYYMLRAFGTSELLTSTLSMVASLSASYLVLRRSSLYAIGYIINDIIVVVLWCFTIKNVGLEFLPTILGYALYFVNDVYALINWKLMERKQRKQKANEESKISETEEVSV